MKKINTLVVGQGIAGSLTAYMLYRYNIPFLVIDPRRVNTASTVAAGMFTPVSGKRNTIHPLAAEQLRFSIETFGELETLLKTKLLHLKNIYQVHDSEAAKNELDKKLTEGILGNYVFTPPSSIDVRQDHGAFEIAGSGWVNCRLFIETFADWLKQRDALMEAAFVHEALEIKQGALAYQGTEFQHIIFCEGYRAAQNPFFVKEQIIPCKGDLLIIQCNHFGDSHIIKKNGIYLIPLGEKIFCAGSTYDWNNDQEVPDETAKKILEERLQDMLKDRYTIIDHRSGVRPTTINREVIARKHPHHKGIFMLNGLGTKGILQGPWWADHLIKKILLNPAGSPAGS